MMFSATLHFVFNLHALKRKRQTRIFIGWKNTLGACFVGNVHRQQPGDCFTLSMQPVASGRNWFEHAINLMFNERVAVYGLNREGFLGSSYDVCSARV